MRNAIWTLAVALCLCTSAARADEKLTPLETALQYYQATWLGTTQEKRRCTDYARTLSTYRHVVFGSPIGAEIDRELRRVKCLDIYSHLFGESILPNAPTLLDHSSVERVGEYLFVYINTFYYSVDDVVEKIKSLEASDVQAVKTVVFDVRSNSGGFVDEVYKLLNLMFSPRKGFHSFYVALGSTTYGEYYETDRTGIFAGREIRILTNGETGSSSEWMLETLCYEWYPDKCVSVGVKTYGKAILQCLKTFKFGKGFSIDLKLTCGEWFLKRKSKQPDRVETQKVQGVGIEPDKHMVFQDCEKFSYNCIAKDLADAGL